jgi:hypothetical protein
VSGWSRYSRRNVLVTCGECGEKTPAVYEVEYGTGDISPEVCGSCGAEFPSDLTMEDHVPDVEPDVDDYDEGD